MGEGCGLKSMHQPAREDASRCTLAAVLIALLQVCALNFRFAASMSGMTLRQPVMP